MGEYVNIEGESTKLGTCEDLYYVTFDQLNRHLNLMSECPGNCRPSEYLKENLGWRYRFPFPDEDGTPIGHHDYYNRGYLVELSGFAQGYFSEYVKDCDDIKPDFEALEIVQQKQVNGQLWTIVRVPGTDDKFRLDFRAACVLATCLNSKAEKSSYEVSMIGLRMLTGYVKGEE